MVKQKSTIMNDPVLDELKAKVGKVHKRAVSFPVSASDIRKYAMAVYWPETPPRLYWDEEYARKAAWGGIIAPEDFNPFAWPIEGVGRFPYGWGSGAGRSFNAGSDAQYYLPIRPGDVITAVEKIVETYERDGKSGRLFFIITESRWTNQRGELVKIMRGRQARVLGEAKK